MEIKTINNNDYEKVAALIREAFTNSEHGYGNEAELVEKIRESNSYIKNLEVVAIENGEIVGHGLLSDVTIVNDNSSYTGLVLAPLETATNYQGKGIGTKIMLELDKRAKKLNYQFISILGHADYYSKFGYVPASKFAVYPPFDVPDEAFMIKPLFEGALDEVQGTVKYSSAFE